MKGEIKRIRSELGSSGDFHEIKDIEAVVDAVNNILGIQKGTYVMDPELGIDLHSYLYEYLDEGTLSEIEDEIRDVLTIYVPFVKLISVKGYKSGKSLLLEITYKYLYRFVTVTLVATEEKNIIQNVQY